MPRVPEGPLRNCHEVGAPVLRSGAYLLCVATKPRVLYSGAAYHITVRSVDGRTLFPDDIFRLAFLDRLARVVADHRWICDAYCLMTNHFHLLVETPEPTLAAGMKFLNGSYAQAYNRRHGRRGQLQHATRDAWHPYHQDRDFRSHAARPDG